MFQISQQCKLRMVQWIAENNMLYMLNLRKIE